MKVLVTGSRNHDPEWVCAKIIEYVNGYRPDGEMTPSDAEYEPHRRLVIIHGDATGADQGAHLASLRIPECVEIRVPARWVTLGKAAGPRRNIEMLDTYYPDVVLAFPLGESRGTRHCMREARYRMMPVVEFAADASETGAGDI